MKKTRMVFAMVLLALCAAALFAQPAPSREVQQVEAYRNQLIRQGTKEKDLEKLVTKEVGKKVYKEWQEWKAAVEKAETAAQAAAAQKAAAAKAEAERLANLPATEDDFEIEQNKQGTITITKYTGKARRVTIPATISGVKVTEIKPTYDKGEIGAFSRNTSIISVVIPDGITVIPSGAFRGCTALQSVTLPPTLKTIGDEAFAN